MPCSFCLRAAAALACCRCFAAAPREHRDSLPGVIGFTLRPRERRGRTHMMAALALPRTVAVASRRPPALVQQCKVSG